MSAFLAQMDQTGRAISIIHTQGGSFQKAS